MWNPATGWLPPELGIGFTRSVGAENCHLAEALMGYSFAEIEKRLPAVIAFAELEDFVEEPVKSYSSGHVCAPRLRLATDIEPDVLLVDEVFGVGDEFFMRSA
jgi:ABC-type polysaccharide/polyol phosphate transport system ATPase subunit